MPNQIYSLNPSTIIVTSSFEENVKKLESVCIPSKHIASSSTVRMLESIPV